MTLLLCLSLLLTLLIQTSAQIRYSLNNNTWNVINSNGTIAAPATVPGNVYEDLMRSGFFGDPYYRYNEREYNWVAYDPYWTFSYEFITPSNILGKNTIDLVFHGIDTFANITLNGVLIGVTDNSFRRYRFDVTKILATTGENTLIVTIASPILTAKAIRAAYPYEVDGDSPANLPYRLWTRKSQSDFGWDWGPGFAPSGIWKDVELMAYDTAIIVDATIITTPVSDLYGSWNVNTTVFIRTTTAGNGNVVSGDVSFEIDGFNTVMAPAVLPYSPSNNGDFVYAYTLLTTVISPNLWWPNGYGEPALYNMSISWTSGQESFTIHRKIGFRTLVVAREVIEGQNGISFGIVANNVPIYAKGANLIPFDVFHGRVTADNITSQLDAGMDAHFNMIRVWGGGIYQDEVLYDYADTHGLMIWQEFIFACAQYPAGYAYLTGVREEVAQITRQLQHHASMAILGGNNENEESISGGTNHDHSLIDYNNLFINTVRDAVVREIGLTIEYVDSSPSNGPKSMDPYTMIWGSPNDETMGDMHYYNYYADCADVTTYPRPRFLSEHGFQSEPSMYSFDSVVEVSDMYLESDMMKYRQRHPDGNPQLLAQFQRQFRMPSSSDNRTNWDDFCYISQAVQSLCYTTAFNHVRRIKQETPGRTQGILYWQLNDIWSGAPTWASIEYGGRWKMVHYSTVKAFAPFIISGYEANGEFGIYAVNDVQADVKGDLYIEIRSWTSGKVVNNFTSSWSVVSLGSVRVYENATKTITQNCAPNECFARIYTNIESPSCGGTTRVGSYVPLGKVANATLQDPQIQVGFLPPTASNYLPRVRDSTYSVCKLLGLAEAYNNVHTMKTMNVEEPVIVNAKVNSVTFNLTVNAPAAYIWLETPILGQFSDNGMHLIPDDGTVVFTFYGTYPFDYEDFSKNLRVRSIYETYNRK